MSFNFMAAISICSDFGAQKMKYSRGHLAKKGFLSDQCKEIEENNRMGKIRDLFKKK